MKNNNKPFSEAIVSQWKQIATANNLIWKDSFLKWDLPHSLNADFAVVIALQLSKEAEKNPYDLAILLRDFASSGYDFEVVVTKEGYLNCKIKDSFYKSYLKEANNGKLMESCLEPATFPRVNIEFVSVNPTGYLHLGHLRNAVVGDVLAKVYTFLGHEVTREYYINDRGNQIEELTKSVLFYYDQQKGRKTLLSEENLSYRGAATKDAAQWLMKNYPDADWSKEKVSNIKEEIISFFTRKIKEDLSLCGVEFDNWFSENAMYSNPDKLNSLIKNFQDKSLVYRKNGALFLRTEEKSDEKDRVLIKSSGEFTYFLSDIIYHIDKMERSDLLIDIWGSDHHGYIERIRSSLAMLGYDQQKRLVFILIQMVSLLENEENRKFSKRLGTAIEIKETLSIVGRDQLRFCLLEKEVSHTVSINLSLLKEQEEKSRLYYLQYAHARCNQLIERAKKQNLYCGNPFLETSFLLQSEKEKSILKNLVRFDNVIYSVITEKKPSTIIQYLQVLAKDFQTYYQSQQIINNDKEELSKQRIFLVGAIKEVLKKGLFLCGVDAPGLMRSMES